MKPTLSLLSLLVFPILLYAQDGTNPWREAPPAPSLRDQSVASVDSSRHLFLDTLQLHRLLINAPSEEEAGAGAPLQLPLPDGRMASFEVVNSPVMEPELAAKYPSIQTFKGKSRTPGVGPARFGITGKGFHASIQTASGTVFIDPEQHPAALRYQSYFTKDQHRPEGNDAFYCHVDHRILPEPLLPTERETGTIDFRDDPSPVSLRVYRLAMAATGEFTAYHGGTVEDALSAIVTMVNRLDQVFERDLAIRLILINSNDALIFTDPATDPYTNGDEEAMLNENPPAINQRIGYQTYDIGHVVGTHNSFGGVALLGGVCTQAKANGASAMRTPETDAFVIDILAHEMGHQFDARHSFNSCHNVSPGTAFEPGGGTTIMSYAGICSNPVNNLQLHHDDYYHVISLQEIFNFSRQGNGDGCAEHLATTNFIPEVDIPLENGFHIPIQTPFELTAAGSDLNGDTLFYSWEQFDLGPENSPPGSPEGNSPLFRSLPPSPSPTRVFPQLETILSGQNDRSEVLPDYSRDLTFRCTVRDFHPEAGAAAWAEVAFRSDSTAGPFRVMEPNSAEARWKAGEYIPVRWDVANTDNNRVNCRFVNIRLSVDGGRTYPFTLLENTPNDGEAFVTVPDTTSNAARVRIEAADNIFFDLSDASFEIWPPSIPAYTVQVTPNAIPQHCLPAPLEFEVNVGSILGYNEPLTFDLIGDLPPEASWEFSPNPVLPLEEQEVLLTLDLGTAVEDTFDLQVRVASPGLDTALRPIRFSTVSNQYDAFRPIAPFDGERGIQLSTTFTWSDAADAENYEFELASSPAFEGDMVETSGPLPDTAYTPATLLEDNRLYFWRVRPVNECGPGPYMTPQVLQTTINRCTPFTAGDVPVNISGSGLPTVESTIFVEEDAVINDVNIPLIKANYQPVKSLKITLISPAGTEAVLYSRDCGNTILFRAGFDDEAPDAIICPPDDDIVYRPVDSLARFIGEGTRGNWTLRVQVVEGGFGASGAIDDWSLEFCANFDPEDPFLLTRETLFVPPAASNPITKKQLEAADNDNTAAELEYLLLSQPASGWLRLREDTLHTGDTFTQEDINSLHLKYTHDGSMTVRDSFYFLVQDGTGGLLSHQTFFIEVDEDAITGRKPATPEIQLELFPNPVQDVLNIRLDASPASPLRLYLLNLQGQVLRRGFKGAAPDLQVDMRGIPAGTYLLRLESEKGVATRKVVVGR